jgi:predicted dehydrogenase
VEANILAKFASKTEQQMGAAPKCEKDFRKILEKTDVDAVTIAAPDHWHAPMAILALQAGKHVYVEKPCSHNPAEGALLIKAQQKYNKLAQMGTQQRSSPHTIEIVQKIHDGIIGRAYYAKCWYTNARKSIGEGKVVPVPATLDWDLWQGPAPRQPYRDNVQPYNWHWFHIWGTGETLNNGTHEIDVCRWALDVEYPNRITSSGGRYHFKDDWQFYDTLITNFEYPDKLISWEGRSRQGMRLYDRDRGSVIMGTKGSVVIDRGGYDVYDWKGKQIDTFRTGHETSTNDVIGADNMTDAHFANFIAAIRGQEELHSPIPVANVTVTMLLLSNIAWFVNRMLRIDPETAHIKDDAEAMKYWGRTYEKGWEVTV